MKKILLPLEETERSLKALHYVKKHYAPAEAELVLMMVDESLGYAAKSDTEAAALRELDEKLDLIAATLDGYKIAKLSAVGKAGLRITRAARETGADMVVITKSSKEGMLSSIGTTAQYIINNCVCDVVIVSEHINSAREYRGLVYKTSKGTVTLRGQLGEKQSECMLPSVNQDCLYHIDMIVGKVRFFHTAYNPDTRNWDQPPLPGQDVTLDIVAGDSRYILVKADSTDGKADRIRIVNRDMKREAVFRFRITAAVYDENGELQLPHDERRAAAMADHQHGTQGETAGSAADASGTAGADGEAVPVNDASDAHAAGSSYAEDMAGLFAASGAEGSKQATRATIEIPRVIIPDNFEEPELPTFKPEVMPLKAVTEAPEAQPEIPESASTEQSVSAAQPEALAPQPVMTTSQPVAAAPVVQAAAETPTPQPGASASQAKAAAPVVQAAAETPTPQPGASVSQAEAAAPAVQAAAEAPASQTEAAEPAVQPVAAAMPEIEKPAAQPVQAPASAQQPIQVQMPEVEILTAQPAAAPGVQQPAPAAATESQPQPVQPIVVAMPEIEEPAAQPAQTQAAAQQPIQVQMPEVEILTAQPAAAPGVQQSASAAATESQPQPVQPVVVAMPEIEEPAAQPVQTQTSAQQPIQVQMPVVVQMTVPEQENVQPASEPQQDSGAIFSVEIHE